MASVQDNLSTWNGSYDWSGQGDEWSAAWGGTEAKWLGTILPRIQQFIPAGTILELAPGFGRWTNYLKNYAERLILVDLAEKCIEGCRERFSSEAHIEYYVNDGKSLDMISDRSIDFVFSFDSLIHAEADVLEAYIKQLAKKLKPEGVGFIHHSNLGMYLDLVQRTWQTPAELRPPLVETGELLNLSPLHAESMTAALFETYCKEAGIQCIGQELISWFNKQTIGCFSVFCSQTSKWSRPNRIWENRQFMDEVTTTRLRSQHYAGLLGFECFHDGVDNEHIWGWAWDRQRPNARLAIDIFDGATPIVVKLEADQYRADIAAYTADDGRHGFDYALPDSIKDDNEHLISVRVSGIDLSAHGSPKAITLSRRHQSS